VRFPLSWWQTLWMLLFLSGLVFRARTAAEISDDPVDAWALFRIGLIFVVALVLFLRICLRRTRWPSSLSSGLVGLFFLYPLISLISTTWSVSPMWTLYKSIEFLTDVFVLAVIVAILQSAQEYKKLVNWTLMLLGFLAVTAWIGAVVDPAEALFSDPTVGLMGLPARLVGIFPVASCNELSELSAVLALVALCRLYVDPEAQDKKGRYRLLLAAAIATLIITQTRGAFAAFFVGLVLLLILTRRYRLAAVAGISSSLVGMALLLLTNFGKAATSFLLRGQTVDQASGISGRGEIWQEALTSILEHPLIGYGGFAGARFVVLSKNSVGSSSLNSYVDAALNIGVGGVLIVLLVAFLVGWSLFKSIDRFEPWKVESGLALEMFLAFVILFIMSFESGNLVTHPPLTFLIIVGAAEILRLHRKSVQLEAQEGRMQLQERPFISTPWEPSPTSAPPFTS
jgi:O-antigen ligase